MSPRTQRQEAAEADSNPGKSLLLVTSTPHAFSSPEAPSPLPGSAAQGLLRDPRTTAPRDGVPTLQDPPPLRMAWSQAAHTASQRALGTKRPPGAPGSGQSCLPWVVGVEAIWERPSKAPGGTTTATSSEVWGDHPLPELSRAQSSTHGARAGLSQSPHCSRPLCCRSTSVPPPHGVGGDEKYLARPPWWSSS